ncbi:10689_t:CDS:1 [Diversispora eburnea]|uniref:10689_t:CDS:1 n=1 Tax=Diversispora eburnea TaxID=1213867 RepID=A0A9N8ZFC9_9GLOM|nr:10689_t:CDS:1 [Diversispora eburnea]
MAYISLGPLVPPAFLQNENTANLILKATKKMNVDDPAIFILWNATGFNDTPLANCRNGVPGQTQGAVVNYILGSGGRDFNGLNTLFLFRNNLAITRCQYGFPLWYEIFHVYF